VYGHDLQHISDFLTGNWFDYERDIARQLTIDAYNRGGVNTYSWHYDNPVDKSDGSFYWDKAKVEAVNKIIPGGTHHNVYKTSLREVADFAKSLVGADGRLVPVIFRPFHEFYMHGLPIKISLLKLNISKGTREMLMLMLWVLIIMVICPMPVIHQQLLINIK
jgi:hypothetical protein